MEEHHLTAAGPDVEARMRALLDAIPDLMFRITADGIYVDFVGDAASSSPTRGRTSSAAGWRTCFRPRSPSR